MRYSPVPNEVYHIEQQMQAQLTRRCTPQEPPAVGEQSTHPHHERGSDVQL